MKKEGLCKKVLYNNFFVRLLTKRILLTLNYCVFFVFFLTFNVAAKSYSQGEKIDLEVHDLSLKRVFPLLEQRGKIRLMYTEETAIFDKLVSINVKEVPVLQVLDMVLANTNLEYKALENGLVVIREKGGFQELTVTGVVTDESKQPLAGVSVVVKGATNKGTTTNDGGQYSIKTNANTTLLFTYVGFQPQEIPVGSRTDIPVTLHSDAEALGEVVVTALGITREKKSLSYSVTQVAGENLTKAREINLGNALTGRVAGLNASSTATGPGGSSRIIIRGNGSLNGDNQPLIVLNGIPMDNTNQGSAGTYGGTDRGDGLSSINPDDIASLSVLKGGTAAALYGSRAANGVILITTKSGSAQKGLGVEYNTTFTMETPRDLLDWQYEYGAGTRGEKPGSPSEAIANGRMSWGAKLDGSDVYQPDGQQRPYIAQKDNIKNFYNTGNTFSNTVALIGGSELANFRFSASNVDNNGIVPNNTLNMKTFNLSVNATLAKKIVFEGRAQYGVQANKNRTRPGDFDRNPNAGAQIIANSIDVRTLAPGYDDNGNEFVWSDYIYVTNPYFAINKVKNGDTRKRFLGSFSIRYNLTDDLYASTRLGIDHYNFDAFDIIPSGIAYNNRGQMTSTSNKMQEINAEAIIGFNKTMDRFSINALAGANQMRNVLDGIDLASGQFNVPFDYFIGNGSAQNYTLNYSKRGINSLFASADLGFNNYLFLNLTAREDWFSTLAMQKNSLLYPSAGLGFVASDAWGTAKPAWLDYLKLRASWAQVGGGAPDPYGLDLTYINLPQPYLSGATLMTINGSNIPNPALKPYTSTTTEAGFEARVLNSRLGLDFTVYDRTTTNDIVNASVPASSGYGTVALNVGKIRNRGVEILLNGTPLKRASFSWDIIYNMAYNQNTVLKISDDLTSLFIDGATTRTLNGGIYHFEGQPFGMIAGNRAARNENGQIIYNKATGIPIQGPLEILGKGVPPFTAGITNTFNFKDFSLSVLIDGKFGAKIYSATNAFGTEFGLDKRTVGNNIRETGINVSGVDQSNAPYSGNVSAQTYYSTIWSTLTDQFVTDADFIKLRSITIGYSLPGRLISKTPFQSASFSLVARNLFFIMNKARNIDPESSYSNGNAQGLENFGLPSVRSYGLNLSVKF